MKNDVADPFLFLGLRKLKNVFIRRKDMYFVQASFRGVTDWYPELSIPIILVVPAEVPIAPIDMIVALEVGALSIISPIRVLDLVDYSFSSDSDPLEDSLPIAPELPLVLPFFCSDDSKADSKSEPADQRPERHESLTPSFEFPLAPVVAPPKIHRRPTILVRPGEAIPFSQPYRTHPNGPHMFLTARKKVRPFPARRLT
nr:hypothetical protein [Tanacetum cinerariifolium]